MHTCTGTYPYMCMRSYLGVFHDPHHLLSAPVMVKSSAVEHPCSIHANEVIGSAIRCDELMAPPLDEGSGSWHGSCRRLQWRIKEDICAWRSPVASFDTAAASAAADALTRGTNCNSPRLFFFFFFFCGCGCGSSCRLVFLCCSRLFWCYCRFSLWDGSNSSSSRCGCSSSSWDCL